MLLAEMRFLGEAVALSPSDISNFLSCRHRAGLDLAVASRQLVRPVSDDPYLALLRKRGDDHEHAYVAFLRAQGKGVIDLKDVDDAAERTRQAMRGGAEVVVQARFEQAGLAGFADILLRVDRPSDLGTWSYEVQDTKLARDTKGGTVLQLSAYSALLATTQGLVPERFQVVTPGIGEAFAVHDYRVEQYAAYYRMVLAVLRAELARGQEAILAAYYPEPVEACPLCVWEGRCVGIRRKDDHLSFVAGAARTQRVELVSQGYGTLAVAAAMPVPVTFTPARGARQTYDRLGHQARVQHVQRTTRTPVVERLPVQPTEGLARLPLPSRGDVFLDLEGAPFARDDGREFLFGVWSNGTYRAWWAMDDIEEQAAFEAVIDLIIDGWARESDMHVYHFNHYEPTAFKKLMGRHVTRGPELDRLLRADRFVDLYPIVRQAVRAGVESYSIKQLEQYTGYVRRVSLDRVHHALFAVEQAFDARVAAALPDEIKNLVQGYNEDDCRSTESLRDWLERLRAECEREGIPVPRPGAAPEAADKPVPPVQQQALAQRGRLLAAVEPGASDPGHPQHVTWLLAYLIDWHRREVNAEWWEYFRLKDLPEDELLDERKAVSGLQFVSQVLAVTNKKTGKPTGSVIHRYAYPAQDLELKADATLKLQSDETFGTVDRLDRGARTIDIKKGRAMVDRHPSCAFASEVRSIDELQTSVMRLAERTLEGSDECALALLRRQGPRLRAGAFAPAAGETAQEFAIRVATQLDRTTLAIQGPPGAGKTFVGAQMILALVRAGKKVGVAATSHKVIRNLLDEIVTQAGATRQVVSVGVKPGEPSPDAGAVLEFHDNQTPLAAIASGQIDVFGATRFFWGREQSAGAVDVLFIDEAGQVSLADVLAMAAAADSLVLLGDPQQLDQPQKASHPDGVGVSALEHVLGGFETMPLDRGIFLPTTWRMSPTLTAFTSEVFYDRKLVAKAGLERQALHGTSRFDGSNLWVLPVEHEGNQSASMEEVEAIGALVDELIADGAQWIGPDGVARPLTGSDLRVVAPFNAQVNRLAERLAGKHVPVGTVDKFQGQTAAVVIYSMTTSRAEDAPRGMEFLYSLNRLNVATSRARCAVFLVAAPRLFEPACHTPRQMQLASALCRYRELATVVR